VCPTREERLDNLGTAGFAVSMSKVQPPVTEDAPVNAGAT
jgi:hypothetical protein